MFELLACGAPLVHGVEDRAIDILESRGLHDLGLLDLAVAVKVEADEGVFW